MRKLLLVGIMIICAGFIYAQEDGYEVEETIIKSQDETYDNIDFLEKNYGHIKPGDIIEIKPDPTPPTPKSKEEQPEASTPVASPTSEDAEVSTSANNITSPSSRNSSSARKSSSSKRTKRKKIAFKRKRPNKIKRKPKLGNRAACPRF